MLITLPYSSSPKTSTHTGLAASKQLVAVTVKAANKSNLLPDYINFLMSPDTPLDFHVNVGDADTIEKIGCVKWMLMARSKVIRVMLLESKLKHEGDLNITDLEPAIFKHFLVYIYGHDNVTTLPFEDALKLLNVAEKYDVQDLKTKLSESLKTQVTADNVFTIIRYAAICEKAPELWEAVTKVIQYQTDTLFTSTQFQTLSAEGMIHILNQDSLSVPEIDVWRAALKWAKYQDKPVDKIIHPENLRSTLLPFLRHIRLCTLTAHQLCKDVLPTRVLTSHEVEQVGISIGNQEKTDDLINICSEIKKRGVVSPLSKKLNKVSTNEKILNTKYTNSYFSVLTKEFGIIVCTIKCFSNKHGSRFVPKGATYLCEGKITITHEYFKGINSPQEPPVEINFSQEVEYHTYFFIRLTRKNRVVSLKANNKYHFNISFASPHSCLHWNDTVETYLDFEVFNNETHCQTFSYRVEVDSQN